MKDESTKSRQPMPGDACRPAKKQWQSPEIMEVDYAMTESSMTYSGIDGAFYS